MSAVLRFGLLLAVAACALAQRASPHDAGSLDLRVRSAIRDFHGKVYLYAKNLDTGRAYGLLQDDRVMTASTVKLPIMAGVFAIVQASKAAWTEELTLTEENRVSGSGVLSELSNGVKLPLRDVLHLMIVVSDNTATNMILDRFSTDAINIELDKIGLRQTRSLRKIRGDGNDLKPPSGYSAAGKLPGNQRFGIGVTTPREMADLLEKLERGEVVNASASKEMIAILLRQQYREGIARRLGDDTPVASKSGALDHLRSDVGIVYSKRGRIVMAITCAEIPAIDNSVDNPGVALIARLAEILIDGLGN